MAEVAKLEGSEETEAVSRCYIGYVFLDVVAFTRRFITNQSRNACLNHLNAAILLAVEEMNATGGPVDLVYIPTGDGVCICLDGMPEFGDTHLRLAEAILARVGGRRTLQIRIAVNNDTAYRPDSRVIDINGRRNFLGDGINTCARIMDFAAPNQMTIGANTVEWVTEIGGDQRLSDKLQVKYVGRFLPYSSRDKHGELITFYSRPSATPPRAVSQLSHISNTYQYAAAALSPTMEREAISTINTIDDFWGYLKQERSATNLPQWSIKSAFRLLSLTPFVTLARDTLGTDDRELDHFWGGWSTSIGRRIVAPALDDVAVVERVIEDCLEEIRPSDQQEAQAFVHTFCLMACCAYQIDIEKRFREFYRQILINGASSPDAEGAMHERLNTSLLSLAILVASRGDNQNLNERFAVAREVFITFVAERLQTSPIFPIEHFFSPILIILAARFGDRRTLQRCIDLQRQFIERDMGRLRSILPGLFSRYLLFFATIIHGRPSEIGIGRPDIKSLPMFAQFWNRLLNLMDGTTAANIVDILQPPYLRQPGANERLFQLSLVNRVKSWRTRALVPWLRDRPIRVPNAV